jgi:hypothetical protein
LAKAQNDSLSTSKPSVLKRYWQFLQPDSLGHNTLLTGAWNYMYTDRGTIMHAGRGSYLGVGFNVARLFSKDFVLAAGVEIKVVKGLWNDRFSQNYIDDFNANFHNDLSNDIDSAKAFAVHDLLNGTSNYTIRGSYYGGYSIAFSPFPDRYGGLMLVAKKTYFGVPVNGTYGSFFNQNGPDWVDISIPAKFCFELVCKPLTFSKKLAKERENGLLQFSIFYERLSWKEASFYGLPFSSFMSDDFIKKYATEDHWGVTLKIGMY